MNGNERKIMDNNLLQSRDYYIDLINSSKANKMTALYHYSGVGFKKAKLNQGIYRKSDDMLVGVLQWGCSAQEGIRLDRYVKEEIKKEEYLELNRFCMVDSEGPNSESQAISLGIKWIKKNRPDIRLLVSYAGRKEGNYGYIYQATNWEYLGYFISNGFWLLDGEERHQITVWYRYKNYCDQSLPFKQGICALYHDVRQTWTKQFIYIQRLDKKLHCASPVLPYPKPVNEFPICTKVEIYKQDDEYINAYKPQRTFVEYKYEKETQLFTRTALARRGELDLIKKGVAVYSREGQLEAIYNSIKDVAAEDLFSESGVRSALKTEKPYKNHFFRFYILSETPDEEIDIPYLCKIDGLRFLKQTEIADYCGVTRQAVSAAKQHYAKVIGGKNIEWHK